MMLRIRVVKPELFIHEGFQLKQKKSNHSMILDHHMIRVYCDEISEKICSAGSVAT